MEALKLYLFVLFDTGETEFLEPVFRRLNPDDFTLLTFGTSESLGTIINYPQIKSSELHFSEKVSKEWPREKSLAEDDLSKLELILSNHKIYISGVASVLQGQIINLFQGKTVMVWDNFKGNDTGFYWTIAKKVQKLANIIVFPSQLTVNELEEPLKLCIDGPSVCRRLG